MRCRLSLLAFAFCLALSGVAVAAPSRPGQQELVTSTTFVIRGHGYGHGVGMGQWGAYGAAKAGLTYDKILAFYYPGTKLAQSPVRTVRVLLADTSGRRDRHVDGAVHSSATRPGLCTRSRAAGSRSARPSPRARGRPGRQQTLAGPLDDPARQGAALLPQALPRLDRAPGRLGPPPGRERALARQLRPRRGHRRDAEGLAACRAGDAGRCGALVRGRDARQRARSSTPTSAARSTAASRASRRRACRP